MALGHFLFTLWASGVGEIWGRGDLGKRGGRRKKDGVCLSCPGSSLRFWAMEIVRSVG